MLHSTRLRVAAMIVVAYRDYVLIVPRMRMTEKQGLDAVRLRRFGVVTEYSISLSTYIEANKYHYHATTN